MLLYIYIYMKCERKQTNNFLFLSPQRSLKVMVISYDADNVFVVLITFLRMDLLVFLLFLGGNKIKIYIFQLVYLFTIQKQ